MRSETVSDIRQRLAFFIREVNYTKNPIVIMQHGSPVALLSPLPPEMMSAPAGADEST
jgi:prevent-host-death family protein